MAMSVHLLVYAGLSLFIIGGSYVYMVVCILYAYNLTIEEVICRKSGTVVLGYVVLSASILTNSMLMFGSVSVSFIQITWMNGFIIV